MYPCISPALNWGADLSHLKPFEQSLIYPLFSKDAETRLQGAQALAVVDKQGHLTDDLRGTLKMLVENEELDPDIRRAVVFYFGEVASSLDEETMEWLQARYYSEQDLGLRLILDHVLREDLGFLRRHPQANIIFHPTSGSCAEHLVFHLFPGFDASI